MKAKEKEIKYPARVTVHWPSGPVDCCIAHVNSLIALGKLLGGHVVATALKEPSECINCINEDKPN